jgi:broad specificity phosphatase PhoE
VPRLQECLTSLHEGETGLAVTHGAALKVGLLGLLRWPESSYRDLGVMENCAWATVTLTGDGRLRLDGYHEKAPRP